jgi:hypothetical protein
MVHKHLHRYRGAQQSNDELRVIESNTVTKPTEEIIYKTW